MIFLVLSVEALVPSFLSVGLVLQLFGEDQHNKYAGSCTDQFCPGWLHYPWYVLKRSCPALFTLFDLQYTVPG